MPLARRRAAGSDSAAATRPARMIIDPECKVTSLLAIVRWLVIYFLTRIKPPLLKLCQSPKNEVVDFCASATSLSPLWLLAIMVPDPIRSELYLEVVEATCGAEVQSDFLREYQRYRVPFRTNTSKTITIPNDSKGLERAAPPHLWRVPSKAAGQALAADAPRGVEPACDPFWESAGSGPLGPDTPP